MGIGSSVYNHIIETWKVDHNPASVCVPSMIPQAFLDFGKIGSLVFFFMAMLLNGFLKHSWIFIGLNYNLIFLSFVCCFEWLKKEKNNE